MKLTSPRAHQMVLGLWETCVRDRNGICRDLGWAGPRAAGVFRFPDDHRPLLLAPPTRRHPAPTPSMDTESASGLAVRPCVKTWASLSSRCHPRCSLPPAFPTSSSFPPPLTPHPQPAT